MGASTPEEFAAVRVCIFVAAISAIMLILWALYREANNGWHYVLAVALVVVITIGAPRLLIWVDSRERIATTPVPKNVGVLSPDSTTVVFNPNNPLAKIRVGQSGVFLVGDSGQIGTLLIPALKA